jgi:CDP-glycerol glycerophosphotransferase (TagB/SpsB family)
VAATDEDRAKARAQVGVPGDEQVVLYLSGCTKSFEPDRSMLPDGQLLLTSESCADATALLLAADVLVTEHHPALFEFPLLRRPVVLLGCACAVRPRRGTRAETYFDLDEQAPGPVVWLGEELRDELTDLARLEETHRQARERWVATYATYDVGTASAAVADYVTDRLGA